MTTDSGARSGTVKFGILIVDGKCGKRLASTVAEANKAKEAGIKLIVVGVGDVDQNELNKIASSSSDVLTVDNYNSVRDLKGDIINRLCYGKINNYFVYAGSCICKRYYWSLTKGHSYWGKQNKSIDPPIALQGGEYSTSIAIRNTSAF